MNKQINIAIKEKALNLLEKYRCKNYESTDIEILNVHLKDINFICNKKIFDKNSLFVRSSTLWELMQPEGNKGKHNFHGLSPEEIFNAMRGTVNPYCIYNTKENRIAVATMFVNNRNEKLLVIIELHAGLENDRFANINKLVSVYPKKNLDSLIKKLDKKDILYIKKENRTGLQ